MVKITPELAKTIAEAKAEYKRGECISFHSIKELDAYLKSGE